MKRYARIFTYLLRHKSSLVLYLLFVLLSIVFSVLALGLLFPFLQLLFSVPGQTPKTQSNIMLQWVSEKLTVLIQQGSAVQALGIICLLIILSILLKNLFLYLSVRTMVPVKHTAINHLRQDVFNKILKLPIGYFTDQKKGDIMSRMTNDVHEIEVSFMSTLEGWIKDPFSILINLSILVYINPALTLIILISLPVIGFIISAITRSLKRDSMDVSKAGSETIATIDETLGGLRVIKAFNAERIIRNKFDRISAHFLHARNKVSYKREMASPLSEFMGVLVFAGILWFGGQMVLTNTIDMNGALFLTYMGLFYNVIDPAKSITGAFSNMQKGSSAMQRIDEILNAPEIIHDNPNGHLMDAFNHAIEFQNVSFSYGDQPILKNINLVIEKGKTVALVGSSGAGKSTLADMIPRFHDVTEGSVLIDGINIKDYSLHSLRSYISIVTQEPILFNDTIAGNIALGMESATMQDIEKAAIIANAHPFIMQKEAGYQTNIGDRGQKLSGGERQRLTIARAVLKNPPILILDEATSSLDTESERLVQDAIENLMHNRTSIVIAHRLSTIRHADEIIVLRRGEIVERGKHEDLIALKGMYHRLVDMQEVK